MTASATVITIMDRPSARTMGTTIAAVLLNPDPVIRQSCATININSYCIYMQQNRAIILLFVSNNFLTVVYYSDIDFLPLKINAIIWIVGSDPCELYYKVSCSLHITFIIVIRVCYYETSSIIIPIVQEHFAITDFKISYE